MPRLSQQESLFIDYRIDELISNGRTSKNDFNEIATEMAKSNDWLSTEELIEVIQERLKIRNFKLN